MLQLSSIWRALQPGPPQEHQRGAPLAAATATAPLSGLDAHREKEISAALYRLLRRVEDPSRLLQGGPPGVSALLFGGQADVGSGAGGPPPGRSVAGRDEPAAADWRDRLEALRIAGRMSAVVGPLNAAVRRLELLEEAEGSVANAAPAMDGWGASDHVAALLGAVLTALEPPGGGAALAAVAAGEAPLEPAAVAEGVFVATHRSVRLRVERVRALLSQFLGNALLETKEAMDTAAFHSAKEDEEGGRGDPTAAAYYTSRAGMIVAQQWLLEEFMVAYQSLVTAAARLQRSQREAEESESSGQTAPRTAGPSPLLTVQDMETVLQALLQFLSRLCPPHPATRSKQEAVAWAEQLRRSAFFTAAPASFPRVESVRLDHAAPHRIIATLHTSEPWAAQDGWPCGLFLQAAPPTRRDVASGAFHPPVAVAPQVDPRLLLTSEGRLLELLLRVTPQAAQMITATAEEPLPSPAAGPAVPPVQQVRVVLSSPHFTPDLLRWAQNEVEQLTSAADGCLRPPRTWGALFRKEAAAVATRTKTQAKPVEVEVEAPRPLALVPPPCPPHTGRTVAPSPERLRQRPIAPPSPPHPLVQQVLEEMGAAGEAEEAEIAAAARCVDADAFELEDIIDVAALGGEPDDPVALQDLLATEEEDGSGRRGTGDPEAYFAPPVGEVGAASADSAPCRFENGVQLLWISDTSMIFQRNSTTNPWGLAIECLEAPEEYPQLLPMRLVNLPPMPMIQRGKKRPRSVVARHPYVDYFAASGAKGWYIDAINGIAARHPDHAVPWMSSLTRMVIRFRRL